VDLSGAVGAADVAGVEDDAAGLAWAAQGYLTAIGDLESRVAAAGRAWADLPAVLDSPVVTPVLTPLMDPAVRLAGLLLESARRLHEVCVAAQRELEFYRGQQAGLVEEIGRFRHEAPGFAAAERERRRAAGDALWAANLMPSFREVSELAGWEASIRRRVADHNALLDAELRSIAARIRAIRDGEEGSVVLPELGTPGAAGTLVNEGMPAVAAAAFTGVGIGAVLAELSEAEVRAAFAGDAELLDWIRHLHPADAYHWWAGLSPAQRHVAIEAAPGLIGNLPGIPYTDRSRANIILLKQTLTDLAHRGLTETDEYTALKAVQKGLVRGADGGLGCELILLKLGAQPLAAISVGNLDTAKNVTFMVPGMATKADSMPAIVRAAENLAQQQEKDLGAGMDSAVVAWIGYHAPGANAVLDEARSANAVAGARNLVADLNGFQATRAVNGSTTPNTSIVAHSYGTLVAAAAVKTAHVDHVVLEGSPGIPTSIAHTVAELKVPKGEVFATQATNDGWAQVGQVLALEARRDPTDPLFGAHDFSSDGTDGSRPVTQHGPLIGKDPDRASYWDAGTQSIANTAKVTLGRGQDIPVEGAPLDRSPDPLGPMTKIGIK